MIKILKIGNSVYRNISKESVDEQGNVVINPVIPQDFNALKEAVLDTLSWVAGRKIYSHTEHTVVKAKAAMEKSIVLLVKIIEAIKSDNNLSFDPSTVLTTNEQTIYNNLKTLADNGYADSSLNTNNTSAISDVLTWYNNEVNTVNGYTTVDELLSYLENISVSGI